MDIMSEPNLIEAQDLISRKKRAQADWLKALQAYSRISADPTLILPRAFDAVAEAHGSRSALIGETEQFSFADLSERSNRYARWAVQNGFVIGDVVGLMMDNRPDYVAMWLGLTRVGVIVALYNTKLIGTSLAHCIRTSAPCLIIADPFHADICADAIASDPNPPGLCVFGGHGAMRRIDTEIAAMSGAKLTPDETREVRQNHCALYIFTSGTTGLPKPAIVSHRRVMHWAGWFKALIDPTPSDRMYNCLPMYHSLGGVVAVWATLLGGGSVLIRERFSAKHFWSDIVDFECTLFQYIGELCRYLVHADADPCSSRHQLRLVLGNGLRPDVWERFVERFTIPRVLEFYAATESNFSLYNLEGEPGAIGRIPPFVAAHTTIRLIRQDVSTGAPLRSPDGFCQVVDVDEPGEAISPIIGDQKRGSAIFEGYLDAKATETKILRDVFEPGDQWLRSGDLMRKDARGFYYFVDRLGDTFRWKGENVATSEVAAALLDFNGVVDVHVAPVSIPGHDGRAGLATIVANDDFDLDHLKPHLDARLPSYAQPLFLHFCAELEITETFRHKRRAFNLAELDPNGSGGRLYVFDRAENRYRPVDGASHAELLAGRGRF